MARGFPRVVAVVVAVLSAALGAACAPLTFSEEGVLDFESYSTVRVELGLLGSPEAPIFEDYLASELRRVSGFDAVTRERAVDVDVVLAVTVLARVDPALPPEEDDETIHLGEEEVIYHAAVSYSAVSAKGEILDRGQVEDEGDSLRGAVENGLDEIAQHYLRPYRF